MGQMQKGTKAGTLDPSFGDNGVVDLVSEGAAGSQSILPLPDGKMLYANNDFSDSYRTLKLRRLNANGFFDSSFGENGLIVLPGISTAGRFSLFSYLDDRFLVKSMQMDFLGHGDIVLRKLDQNGQIDTTFGTDGVVNINPWRPTDKESLQPPQVAETKSESSRKRLPILYEYQGGSVCVQPDGKTLVAHTGVPHYPDHFRDGMVFRLMPDGSLDKTFNERGFLYVKLEGVDYDESLATSIAYQKDGKILVAGIYFNSKQIPTYLNSYIVRYKEDGQLDADFNNGRAVIVADSEFSQIEVGTISVRDGDGAIVVVGGAKKTFDTSLSDIPWLAVLTPSGSLNLLFNNGKPLFSKESPEWSMWQNCEWQEGSSSIIVAGGQVAARYLSSGLLDLSFDGKGWFARIGSFKEMKVTKDQKLVLVGRATKPFLLRCLL